MRSKPRVHSQANTAVEDPYDGATTIPAALTWERSTDTVWAEFDALTKQLDSAMADTEPMPLRVETVDWRSF